MPAPTLDEIKARVPKDIRDTRSSIRITEAFNIGRTKIVETRIRNQQVLSALGGEEGAAVIDAIRNAAPPDGSTPARRKARPMAYALEALHPNSALGLDVGNAETRAMLDSMVQMTPPLMTQAQADKLKALAVVPDPATEPEIRAVIWSVDSRWLLD